MARLDAWWLAALVLVACDDGGSGGAGGTGGADGAAGAGGADQGPGGAGGADQGAAGAGGADQGPGGAGGAPGCFQLTDGPCVEETFKNPEVLQPNDQGVYELELVPTEFMVGDQRHCGRSYNGLYPAPTIDTPIREGDTQRQVRVNLRNRFTRNDVRSLSGEVCACVDSMSGQSCDPTSAGHGADHACVCTNAAGETCHMFDFNVTNLHAHGSHVRPDYATGGGCVEADGLRCRGCTGDRNAAPRACYHADDVISRVAPGEGVQHRWDIDEDGTHHEGLQWYHPHIHGTTAIQVASGATGAWIVRGPVDELPGIKNAKERIMLIMTPPTGYEPLAEGEPCDENHITFNEFHVLGDTAEKQLNLINGIRQPRMIMPPGQIERWRFLHGAFLDEVTIAVFKGLDANCQNLDFDAGPIPLTQIGRDGLALPKPPGGADWPFAPPYLFMSPGYRIDALLDGSQLQDGDTLCLMSGRFLQTDENGVTDEPVGILTPPTVDDILRAITNGDLIGIVNVTAAAGAPTETQMPDLEAVAARAPSFQLDGGAVDAHEKCQEVAEVTEPAAIDQATVLWAIFYNNEGYDACGCSDHNLNCRNFELTDREAYPYDRVLTKGKVDHWRVVSGFDGHPFHIHINPFVVCPLPPEGADHPNTKARLFEPPFAHWRDTYLVNLDRSHDFITEYRAFTGDFVYHCHKLNHEDHGMMELIRVCDPATEDCNLCNGRPCGWRTCAEGDVNCQREVAASDCILDPSKCPEALLRCLPCNDEGACPPGGYCSGVASGDGQTRCVPGCTENAHCRIDQVCTEGACEAAPPCAPPCRPGEMCRHGACE